MDNGQITRIEWATLQGARPRAAGCNARLPAHGRQVRLPIVRLTTGDGAAGFGRADAAGAQALLGQRLESVFALEPGAGVGEPWFRFEYPILDLAGRRSGVPVYKLAAAINEVEPPHALRAPCYDTSLYFDDLHLVGTQQAADLIASEAREGLSAGHRAFKIKVGRGAMHLPLAEGTERDIAIIRAVREAVGPGCTLMIDANNGYNLNLAKQVLEATRDCDVFWIEEAFHEDPALYRELKRWQGVQGLNVLVADGEGDAASGLLSWARDGLVDAIQYDIFGMGFTRWLRTGRQLDAWGVRSAPHHYGGHYGNYATCHLAAAITGFAYAEWDEVTTPGLDASAYAIDEGHVIVPDAPGFGLELDEDLFQHAVRSNGGIAQL